MTYDIIGWKAILVSLLYVRVPYAMKNCDIIYTLLHINTYCKHVVHLFIYAEGLKEYWSWNESYCTRKIKFVTENQLDVMNKQFKKNKKSVFYFDKSRVKATLEYSLVCANFSSAINEWSITAGSQLMFCKGKIKLKMCRQKISYECFFIICYVINC